MPQTKFDNIKTVLSINTGNYGSTGNIMRGISNVAEENGYICWQTYAPDKKNGPKADRDILVSSYNVRRMNELYSRFTGMRGFSSYFSTFVFLKKVDKIKPDIIHLHNLHNNYIHVGLLFDYIKKHHIKVIWTLHDCWAFTGRCPYFDIIGCDRWKTGCYACLYPQNEYPSVMFDRTDVLWKRKKKAFTGVENMTIVTPSKWLAGLVQESFLSEYPIKVINNGIDFNVFKPTKSDFCKRHKIGERKILLGVSFDWAYRKGLDVFIELNKMIDKSKYVIVIVGVDKDVKLPANIIAIERTNSKQELAEIYTAADVFVNPTREENFPTVNIEALACGTPVVTFRTGGSAEIINSYSGISVEQDDMEGLMKAIKDICEGESINTDACLTRARCFDQNERFREYIDLYKNAAGRIE